MRGKVAGDILTITLWRDTSTRPMTVEEVRRRTMILLDMYPDALHVEVLIAGVSAISIRRCQAVRSGFVASQVMSMV